MNKMLLAGVLGAVGVVGMAGLAWQYPEIKRYLKVKRM
jgi:hypothetical protein